ncbi:MAG: hypothetical protein MZV49_11045 [Rhodopseudomonas palustris]|nr:hypothetical protein [Rhodopseudomonas palustris]
MDAALRWMSACARLIARCSPRCWWAAWYCCSWCRSASGRCGCRSAR